MQKNFTDRWLGGERGKVAREALPPNDQKQVDHWDTREPGLGVRVSSKGIVRFFVSYRWRGVRRQDTLKPAYPALTLEKAREEARAIHRDVAGDSDPRLSNRSPLRHYFPADSASSMTPSTYREAVEEYIRRYQIGQQGNVTANDVRRALLKVGVPWSKYSVSEITPRMIRAKLESIRDGDDGRKGTPYMANRTYAYLRTFFSWCAEPGIELCERSPMDGLKKPWAGEASRDDWFNDDQIAAIWLAANDMKPHYRAIIQLGILTGKRKTAIASMKWSEIDDSGYWKPPKNLTRKRGNKRKHPIPLPQLAMEIIRSLPRVEGSDFLFPSRKSGQHFAPRDKFNKMVARASGIDGFKFHTLRHTLETRCGELGIPPHIKDLILDHAPNRGAGAGYDHYDYSREVAEALGKWASHVSDVVQDAVLIERQHKGLPCEGITIRPDGRVIDADFLKVV